MSCFVCELDTPVLDEHHIIMQSRGGSEGPTVYLCATCHSLTHRASHRMLRGKSYDDLEVHLDHDQRSRLSVLVHSIVIVEARFEETKNPRPLLAVKLDQPEYLAALNMLQRDRGFSSRDKLVNAILRRIAIQYGLVADDASTKKPEIRSIKDVRTGQLQRK